MPLEQHPRSIGFVWPKKSAISSILSAQQIEAWNRDGYLLLKQVLPISLVQEVESLIDPLEAESEEKLRQQGGKSVISTADALTFSPHLVTRSESLRRFAAHDLFAELCLNLLGPDARLYWDQAVYKKPGNPEEFPWHQDNGYTFIEPQDYLTCWVPLTDATESNGCPWVIPGAHLGGTYKHRLTPLGFQCTENPDNAVPVCAEPGDIVAFSSLTPHRTGPNLSQSVRKAYILQYAHNDAEAITRDGERLKQQDPVRQFEILKDGQVLKYEPAAG